MKILAIVNPKSGRHAMRGVVRQTILLLMGEGWLCEDDIRYTTPAGIEDADAWIATPCDVIFVAGGDGTLHLAVVLVGRLGIDVPIAYLPTGTMNDLGHTLHLPRNPAGFLRMMKEHEVRRIDLGRVGGEYFHYVVAGGMMAQVCYDAPQRAKNLMGRLAYYGSVLGRLPRLLASSRVRISWENGQESKSAIVFMVSNASTLAGFPHMAPHASLDDGLLDVCIIEKTAWYKLVPLFFRILSGTHISHPSVSYFQARSVDIVQLGRKTVPMVVDGERGPPLPVHIEVVPQALRMIVPVKKPPQGRITIGPVNIG